MMRSPGSANALTGFGSTMVHFRTASEKSSFAARYPWPPPISRTWAPSVRLGRRNQAGPIRDAPAARGAPRRATAGRRVCQVAARAGGVRARRALRDERRELVVVIRPGLAHDGVVLVAVEELQRHERVPGRGGSRERGERLRTTARPPRRRRGARPTARARAAE